MNNIGKPSFDDGNNIWNYSGPAPELVTASEPMATNTYGKQITGQEIIKNKTINFHYAELAEGVSLIIRNSTLIMGIHPSDMSYIDLQPNATLEVYDSKIIHHKYGGGFTMDAGERSNFILKNTEIRGAGHEWWYSGMFIMADNSVVENCTFYETSIVFQGGCNGARFIGNKVLHSYTGILFENVSSNILIADNIIDGAIRDGITGHGQNTNMTIRNNQIRNVWGDGIECYGFRNSIIEDNTIYNIYGPFSGINSLGSNSKALNNKIYNCYFGIYNNPENVEIVGNDISLCNTGFLLKEFGQSTLSNNITNCNVGIKLDAANNTVNSMIIADCDTGILVSKDASENVIYGNDFIDNKIQAFVEDNRTYFEFQGAGNFWSDYIGRDENGDGIGDTPYIVQNEIWDNFPLMSPGNMNVKPIFLNISSKNIVPTSFSAGDTNIVIAKLGMRIALEDSGNAAIWLGFRMDRSGTGQDSDISSVKIWKDIDNDELFNTDSDSLIGHEIVNDGKVNITLYNEEQITFTPNRYFITIDISSTISEIGNTIGFSCQDSCYFIIKFPAKVKNKNFPMVFNEQTLPVEQEKLVPLTFSIEQNFPNPFNSITTIKYQLPKNTYVSLKVYNLIGRLINTLAEGRQTAGHHKIQWNGKDKNCQSVASGVYIYYLKSGGFSLSHKMVLIR